MALSARAADYIPNSGGVQLVEESRRRLQTGDSLILFPEGTRTTPGESIRLQRGAANIALRAGADMLPVTIQLSATWLTKHSHWYNVPMQRPHFIIRAHAPIDTSESTNPADQLPLAARRLTLNLQDFYRSAILIPQSERELPR